VRASHVSAVVSSLLLVACGISGSGKPSGDDDDDGAGGSGSGSGAGAGAGSGAAGPGAGAGPSSGGGSSNPVPEFGATFTVIGDAADGLNLPRDLAFHPQRGGEAWTVNQPIDGTVIYFDVGTAAQSSDLRIDYYAAHFMDEVSSVAMGAGDTFATCGESHNTWNGEQPGDDFMGPSLWTADLSIYGVQNQGTNDLLGSHIDMLHESPLCMGIAHDTANVYWVFDGMHGKIVRYDFKQPHGVGEDDHTDGVIRVYRDTDVTRVAGVPSHLELDHDSGWLYIADTGGQRVVRLDTKSGSVSGSIPQNSDEYVAEYSAVDGATVEVFADTDLSQPSGVALGGGRVFVGDHQSNVVVAYDAASGEELARLQTPATGMMGIEIGPDGRLYYVDGAADELVRVDP
jgi:hypothetical protein